MHRQNQLLGSRQTGRTFQASPPWKYVRPRQAETLLGTIYQQAQSLS